MPIHWDDIPILRALDQLEARTAPTPMDGEQLIEIVADAERCAELHRIGPGNRL